MNYDGNNDYYPMVALNDAFHEGVGGYYLRIHADDNPYNLQTSPQMYAAWHDGWLFAKKHAGI